MHRVLEGTTAGVLSGKLSPYQGVSVSQLINAQIRLLEFEKSQQEQDALVERLERLESGAWLG